MRGLAILTIFLVVNTISAKVKLNQLVNLCSKSDPKLNECATKSANGFLPHLIKGIRDYNLPPIDPLKLPFMILTQSDKEQGLKLNLSDSTHVGLGLMKFKDVRFDFANEYTEIDLDLPKYEVIGTCTTGGKLLLFPITGHGPCNLTIWDSGATLKIHAGPEKRDDGKVYLKIKNFFTDFRLGKAFMHLDGLFDGNKQLGEAMNRFLNENALEVFIEMKPTLGKVYGDLFRSLMERIYNVVPLNEIWNP